jgi:hypothetical protein
MTDKPYTLNFNVYRNTMHMVLAEAKRLYGVQMVKSISMLPQLTKVAVRYTLFPASNRLTDISNVCVVHDKFFMDCLVKQGKLTDDNYNYCVEIGYRFGNVDKANPRVEIEIYEV